MTAASLAPWFNTLRQGTREDVLSQLAKDPSLATAAEPGGMPAIFLAAMRGDVEIVRKLLDLGAEADRGFTTLGVEDFPVTFAGSAAVAALLLERGAKLEHATLALPIRNAAKRGRALVDFLLTRGVKPTVQNLLGAVETGDEALVRDLTRAASQDVRDDALAQVCDSGDITLAGVLLDAGASLDTGEPLVRAASADHTEMVTWLLSRGADPNRPIAQYGDVPLVAAAFEGAEAAAFLLLDAGADPARTNAHGQSAIDGAKESGAEQLLARLLKKRG